MKTKAYKLAAELGLHEQSVLEWLRSNGYPNVRRADMIRADVAQAARKALRSERPAGGARTRPPRQPQARSGRMDSGHRAPEPAESGADSLSVSLAELLDEHLPASEHAGTDSIPKVSGGSPYTDRNATVVSMPRMTVEDNLAETIESDGATAIRTELARIEAERADEALRIERAQVEALERELKHAQQTASEADVLRRRYAEQKQQTDALLLERTQLKHQIDGLQSERQTLEATCPELQNELTDLRSLLDENESLIADHDSVLDDLQTAREREVAWRTRALKLERAAHAADDISSVLKQHGLDSLRAQRKGLMAILNEDSLTESFLRVVKRIDAAGLRTILGEQLKRVCSHPVCNKVAMTLGRFPLVIDDDTECTVCAGRDDQRWFSHLAAEGERAGVRRFLVIGGKPDTQLRLRQLAEGQPIDLRLISTEEEANPGRISSRVEGADCLILWNSAVSNEEMNQQYEAAALEQLRLVVRVLGETADVKSLCRAASYRIARTHLFRVS